MEYEAQRFTEFLHAKKKTGHPKPLALPKGGKVNGKNFAMSCGVKVAGTLMEFGSPDLIHFALLPDRCALKATNLYSSQGVYLLQRRGTGFYEMIRNGPISGEEIVADLKRACLELGRSESKVIAEELLVGENGPDQIPIDYKFWMFGETVGAISQVNRNSSPRGFAMHGPEFQPVPEGSFCLGPGLVSEVHLIPSNAGALIETARLLSAALDIPFCGIDLYTTGREVIFGEITQVPGPPYFGRLLRLSPEFDKELGAYCRLGFLRRGMPIPKISSPPPAIINECLGGWSVD